MSESKPYFHDRLVLFVLTINTFLAIVCILIALSPLINPSGAIISQYRSNLGIDGYQAGETIDIISFAVFAAVVYAFQFMVSKKLYHIRKHASIIVLLLATILLIFTIIVSNALLELR